MTRTLDSAAAVRDVGPQQHGAENRLDAELEDRPLEPAAEGHLVVIDGLGVAGLEMQVTGQPQVAENVVEDTVRELAIFRAVAEYAAEQPDQGMHHLPADQRQRVDQDHVAVQPGRLDGRRQARDPGADHAHVGADLVRGPGGRPGDFGQVELGEGVRH